MFGPSGAASLDAMDATEVKATLRDMWETRPVRPRADRKIAGVAAAIARRYDVDPVLVRVGLVAAAFAGVGVALYIFGWALLPGEHADGTAPDRGRPGIVVIVLLGLVAALSIGHALNNPAGFLVPAAVVAALLFLLHRSRGAQGAVTTGGTGAPVTEGVDAPTAGATAGAPPAWDPLGAAPFAWDLPEPGPAPAPVPTRRRSRVTPVTLALTLLAGGVTALVLLAAGGLTDLPVLLGVVLAVLGGGLVVGAFTRSGRGLIPFALLASAVTWAVLAAPLDRIAGPPQSLELAPVTPAALAPHYAVPLGSVELDLRGMDLSVPPGGAAAPVQTRIDAGLGSVDIQVPRDADVRFSGTADMGSITFDDRSSDGHDAHLTVDDLGADGVHSGRPIVLDVHAGLGAVEVQRG
jgi:phage shock protein PspC (stress-responsive transcriptional regulator)